MSGATAEALRQAGGHGTEASRVRLGSNASTPAHVLAGLACDPAVTVRAAVAMNPACPPHLDQAISQDADDRVRTLLARKLASSASGTAHTAYGQLRATLAALAADAVVRVRAVIADGVKAMPDAPRELILQLAHDTALSVCDPVVRLSPLLTDADLLALLAALPHPAIAASVASRPGLSATLADAVAAGADSLAIRTLLCNHSALIREATLDALIEQAAPHPDWHGPLVRRPLLTPRAMEALAGFVGAQLMDVLLQRADLDPAAVAQLRRLMAAGLLPRAAPPAPDNDEEALLAPLRQLDAAGGLNEATLIDAARAGDLRRVAAVLAVASGLTPAAVDRAAAQRHARALVGLAWKAGFSMRAAMVVQAALGRLAPGALIPAGPGGAFPLTADEMQWQLEVLAQSAR
jgi:uncharacterized protein (DUF2336 family)